MKDSILACDRDHYLSILVNEYFFQSISKFFFVDKVVNFGWLCSVLNRLNKSICDHQIGSFKLAELKWKTDRSLFVIQIKSVNDAEFIVFDMPRSPSHRISTWQRF